jgi:flagellar basal body-associated protein FliL
VIAALMMFGVLAVLTVIVLVAAPWSEGSKSDRAQAHQDAISQPQSISPPDYGQKPKHPGDPGGWEQLALLGLLVVAVGSGTAWVVHTSRKAKRAQGHPMKS